MRQAVRSKTGMFVMTLLTALAASTSLLAPAASASDVHPNPAVLTAIPATANNPISGQATYNCTTCHESFVRHVTDSSVTVRIQLNQLPAGGVCVALGNAKISGDPRFTGWACFGDKGTHNVATDVVGGTAFVLYIYGVHATGGYSGSLNY